MTASEVIVLEGPLTPNDVEAICGRVETLLAAGRCQDIVCAVTGRPDLSIVDALARVALLVQRSEAHLLFIAADTEANDGAAARNLAELVALTGLECLQFLRIAPLGQQP